MKEEAPVKECYQIDYNNHSVKPFGNLNEPRFECAATFIDGKLFVFGGSCEYNVVKEIEMYDFKKGTDFVIIEVEKENF